MNLIKIISWNALPPESLLYSTPLLKQFRHFFSDLVQRNSKQMKTFQIKDQLYNIQLPITFTPYAAAQPCSARCWFCSENLRFDDHTGSNALKMIDQYHLHLDKVLNELISIPLGLSLSGLEFSDVPDWALKTVDCLLDWQKKGANWTEKALYSNIAGFANLDHRKYLLDALKKLRLDRMEVSRHHFDEFKNTTIMRFRKNQPIQSNNVFIETLTYLQKDLPIRLVCILQKGGIESLEDINQYLIWAKSLGISHVIFRELSDISDNRYNQNGTFRRIQLNTISIENIIEDIFNSNLVDVWQPKHIESGYYYWNAVFDTPYVTVVFERSDYGVMKLAHDSNVIHKLVFHPNGNLCSDWTPDLNILIEHVNE